MKFYNLGNESFETYFGWKYEEIFNHRVNSYCTRLYTQ